MSGRRWRTGDVAMVTARWIRTDDHSERYAVRRPNGWWSRATVNVGDHEVSNIRPLVVLDPEDREQVERLTGCLAVNGANPNDRNYWRETQAALREFANPTPPKPDEPTGLGAVVEDAEGQTWIRGWKNTWHRPDLTAKWAAVAAVRVLSEGVTP